MTIGLKSTRLLRRGPHGILHHATGIEELLLSELHVELQLEVLGDVPEVFEDHFGLSLHTQSFSTQPSPAQWGTSLGENSQQGRWAPPRGDWPRSLSAHSLGDKILDLRRSWTNSKKTSFGTCSWDPLPTWRCQNMSRPKAQPSRFRSTSFLSCRVVATKPKLVRLLGRRQAQRQAQLEHLSSRL